MGYDFTEQDLITAIKGSGGYVTDIAKRLNCSWHCADRNIKKHENALLALEEENESFLDETEKAMKKKIEEGDSSMIKFALATKGKKRGYTEKQEIDLTGSINIVKCDNDDEYL